MTTDTELRKLAEAYPMEYDPIGKTGEENLQRCLNYNALHAACTPETILSLLDRLEKAEKDAGRYRVLRDYLLSDDTSHDDAIVNTTTAQQMNLVVDSISFDAAMEATK